MLKVCLTNHLILGVMFVKLGERVHDLIFDVQGIYVDIIMYTYLTTAINEMFCM